MSLKKDSEIKALKEKVRKLEKQLKLGGKDKEQNNPKVKVPKQFEDIFKDAEKVVGKYFGTKNFDPSKGTITINDQRYILVRASALSYDFFNSIKSFYKDRKDDEAHSIANDFLFDMSHVIGMEDAKKFHQKMKLKNPISKLSAGPIHFAYSGWAYVDIHKESKPTPNENFFLKYTHPFSFEADSYLKAGKKSKKPVCIMNAGYSSGWCEQSFGIPLTAVEITCKGRGDKECLFIMAPPSKISSYLKNYKKVKEEIHVPTFLERKKIEEQLLRKEQILNQAQEIAQLGSWEFDLTNNAVKWSDELYRIFEIDKKTPSNKLFDAYLGRMPEVYKKELFGYIDRSLKKGIGYAFQHSISIGKRTKWLSCSAVPVKNDKGKVVQLIGIAQDITESVNQKAHLENNLKEKETLLKEIHHRVKNNLQIISSLLNLQAYTINDPDAKEKYRESIGRVKSMALIHEMLYQTKNLSEINASVYLNELSRFISDTYRLNNDIKIKLNIDKRIKSIDMNKAIPCGLLINEMLSNCMKYAFIDKKKGQVSINLAIAGKSPTMFELSVSDNGKGFENPSAYKNPTTLGLQLIHTLSEQIGGKIKFKTDNNGTMISVVFR
ncbi:MAG: histidine kinase dimerization/phosphoacceptor domain -containing protein [Bacteroidia bacterium]